MSLPVWLRSVFKWPIVFKLITTRLLRKTTVGKKTAWVCTIDNDNVKEKVQYTLECFSDYITYGRITEQVFQSTHVLEIGSGENLGIGLIALIHGAEKVTALDKFNSLVSVDEQLQIYTGILNYYGFDNTTLDLKSFPSGKVELSFQGKMVSYFSGIAAESIENVLEASSVNLILSRAVLEHVDDVDQVFRQMDKVLNSKGIMIHEVDFRDHGIFSDYGLHTMSFLTIPKKVWDFALRGLGAPNRKLVDTFSKNLNTFEYSYEIFRIHVFGDERKFHTKHLQEVFGQNADLTSQHTPRNKLLKEFRHLKTHDLLTAGIFFRATKR